MLALICIGQAWGGGREETESIKRGSLRFPGGSGRKESACNAEDLGSIPGLGRLPGDGCPSSILAWRILWLEEPGRL